MNVSSVQYYLCCLQTSEELNLVGDRDRRTVLDAFFLGKAVAEALNERIESTVGEFLSSIGRLQAEQQKQVLDFQVVNNSTCNKSTIYSTFFYSSFWFISFITAHISLPITYCLIVKLNCTPENQLIFWKAKSEK